MVKTKPDKKRLKKLIQIVTYAITTGMSQQYFFDKRKDLMIRQDAANTAYVFTFGDLIFDFCTYRKMLKTFSKTRLQHRNSMRMLNYTCEAVRAVTKDCELPFTEEFYRNANYKAF